MNKANDLEILNTIFEAAYGVTAPVTVQIGRVVNNVCEGGIVVKNAPPAVVRKLTEKYMCDLTEDGLRVIKI